VGLAQLALRVEIQTHTSSLWWYIRRSSSTPDSNGRA
jgi:hypothetical protein